MKKNKKRKTVTCNQTTKSYLKKHPELVDDMLNIVSDTYKTASQIQNEYRKEHPESNGVEISKLCSYVRKGYDPDISAKFVFKTMDHETKNGRIRSAIFFKAADNTVTINKFVSQSDYNDYQEFLEFKKFQKMKYENQLNH